MEGEKCLDGLVSEEINAIKTNSLYWRDFYPVMGVISLKDKARERKISSWQAFYMTAWHFGLSLWAIYIFKELIS